jgi:hypothetical protein
MTLAKTVGTVAVTTTCVGMSAATAPQLVPGNAGENCFML